MVVCEVVGRAGRSAVQRRSVMSKKKIAAEVEAVWKDIEKWYKKKSPKLLKDLREGVSEREIAEFEKTAGVSLPEDYKASLSVHDGEVYVHDYNYLSLESVAGKWESAERRKKKGDFKGREVYKKGEGIIRNTFWHRDWIPFAEDGGGNYLCIDLAPAKGGVVGQILKWERESGPYAMKVNSFLAWLKTYRDYLHAGVYVVDKEGFIVEKD